jgi:hypothetical protein
VTLKAVMTTPDDMGLKVRGTWEEWSDEWGTEPWAEDLGQEDSGWRGQEERLPAAGQWREHLTGVTT